MQEKFSKVNSNISNINNAFEKQVWVLTGKKETSNSELRCAVLNEASILNPPNTSWTEMKRE